MSIKIKVDGEWVDPDDAAYLRQQHNKPAPAPPLDVAALPADVTLAKLGDLCPDVRRYITLGSGGVFKVRSGLTVEQQKVAQEILKRYEGVTP